MFGIASFRGRERLLGNTHISKDIQKHLNQPTQLSNKIQVGALSWPIYIITYWRSCPYKLASMEPCALCKICSNVLVERSPTHGYIWIYIYIKTLPDRWSVIVFFSVHLTQWIPVVHAPSCTFKNDDFKWERKIAQRELYLFLWPEVRWWQSMLHDRENKSKRFRHTLYLG